MENSVFNELNKVNVNDFVEKKKTGNAQLSYLSWTQAWKEVKSRYPEASYEIVKFENGLPYCFDKNTGYMVYTKVTIEGITHEMCLPVMDNHNDSMLSEPYEVKTKYGSYKVDKCTMFDVNKTIMRCLTKNLAMFGLGLYIYAGEDLPLDISGQDKTPEQDETPKTEQKALKGGDATPEEKARIRELCEAKYSNGNQIFTADEIRQYSSYRTEKTAAELITYIENALRNRNASALELPENQKKFTDDIPWEK